MQGQTEGFLKTKTVSSRGRSVVMHSLFSTTGHSSTLHENMLNLGLISLLFLVVVNTVRFTSADSQTLASSECLRVSTCSQVLVRAGNKMPLTRKWYYIDRNLNIINQRKVICQNVSKY